MGDHVHSFGPRGRGQCSCGIVPGDHRMFQEVKASGRYCHVVTYFDGTTPIRASLLFRSPDDAAMCADLLREASLSSGKDGGT